MAAYPSKFNKSRVQVSDHIAQFCDHKKDCTNKKCLLEPTSKVVVKDPETDIAYSDARHCKQFRSADGAIGADITEVGIWK